jgi:site-specific recombinase XerD
MNNDLSKTQEEFVDFLKDKGRATATILAYGNDIIQFIDYLSKNSVSTLEEIKREDVENFKNDLLDKNYTAKSVARKLNSIKTYFRFLKTKKQIDLNPSDGVSHPKYVLTPPRILTKMEYRSLRDACRHDARMYAIVEIFLQTGIRISELARLSLDNSLNKKIIVKAFESHEQRVIPLNKPAHSALEAWLKKRPRTKNRSLFITKTGKMFQVRNIRTALDRYFKLADIQDATVNDLRHTFIAHQLKAGTPLTLVSKLAGHKRLSTTEKYLEFIKEKSNSDSARLEEL